MWCPLDAGEAFDKDSSTPAGPTVRSVWIASRRCCLSQAAKDRLYSTPLDKQRDLGPECPETRALGAVVEAEELMG